MGSLAASLTDTSTKNSRRTYRTTSPEFYQHRKFQCGRRFADRNASLQWFHQPGQLGEALDQFLDAGLELHLPDHSDLEAEVTQSTAQVVLNGNGLRLKQFAMGQQHS